VKEQVFIRYIYSRSWKIMMKFHLSFKHAMDCCERSIYFSDSAQYRNRAKSFYYFRNTTCWQELRTKRPLCPFVSCCVRQNCRPCSQVHCIQTTEGTSVCNHGNSRIQSLIRQFAYPVRFITTMSRDTKVSCLSRSVTLPWATIRFTERIFYFVLFNF
jgi:hypothetical protein